MPGHGGVEGLGHAAYLVIASYGLAILLTTYPWSLILVFPAAILTSALAAVMIGCSCIKLTAMHFAMLAIAFGQFL